MRVKVVFLFFFVFFSTVVHAALPPNTTIQHEKVSGFFSGQRVLIEAQLNDSKGVNAARCYFRAGETEKYLYVSMQRISESRFQCTLPVFADGAGTLEYFFLVVNGSHQVIRSAPYSVYEEGDDDLMENRLIVDRSVPLQVYSELGILDKEDSAIIDEWVEVVPTSPGDQLFGLRAGIYEEEALPDSLHYVTGFFGAFILNATDNTVIRPIKGFAVSHSEMDGHQGVHPKQKEGTISGLAGDDWVGYFVNGASGTRKELTATVIMEGSSVVHIVTSLTGLGHYLRGKVNSSGDMLLYDSYDGEDWTTHYGPATDLMIGIYDYIYRPQPDEPPPPLNEIVLYRPPQPPSGVLASNGEFTDKTVVSWDPSDGADYYEIYICTSNLTESCTVLSQEDATPYDDIRQISGVGCYRVKACNQAGCGEFSEPDTGYSRILLTPMFHLLL